MDPGEPMGGGRSDGFVPDENFFHGVYPGCLFFVLCSTFLTIVKRFISGHKNRAKVLLTVFCKEIKQVCVRVR